MGTRGHARAHLRAIPPLTDLTVDQAADRLHCSRRHMFRLLADGSIPSTKVGRRRMVESRHLDAYLEDLRAAAHR